MNRAIAYFYISCHIAAALALIIALSGCAGVFGGPYHTMNYGVSMETDPHLKREKVVFSIGVSGR